MPPAQKRGGSEVARASKSERAETVATGWWTLTTTGVEPNEIDLENIAEMIKQGYTNGQLVHDDEEEGNNGR